MEDDITSCYELWEILDDQSDLKDEEYVQQELVRHKTKLLKGLAYYIKPSSKSKEILENEKRVKALQRDFILKVSKFLNLDEMQSLKLFHSYLQNSYRGSKEELQEVLQHEIHTETLLLKVMEYYFQERNSILKCLEGIMIQSRNTSHPHMVVFSRFLDDLMKDNLITQVWEEYKMSCKTLVHLPSGDDLDMVKRHSHMFARQLLKEQIAVLRLLFLLFKFFDEAAESLCEAMTLFQSQMFGTRQLNKHSFDGYTKLMVTHIGFLQVMILLEGMKLDSLIEYVEGERLNNHVTGKQLSEMKKQEKVILKWGDLIHHAPLMLAWAAVRFLVLDTEVDTPKIVQTLGTRALQSGVFPYLLHLLKSPPFLDDTSISNLARSTIYNLLSVILTLFQENTLGDPVMLVAVLKETLRSSDLCESFWNSELNSGMAIILKSATNRFPYQFSSFTQIMASLAKDRNSSENVFHYLDKMKYYTELSNNNSVQDVDVVDSDETSWRLCNAKILYKSVVSTSDKIVIPTGTLGKLSVSNEGVHLLRWSFNYSCWQLFLLELDSFLQYMPHASDRERLEMVNKVLDIIEILNTVLLYDWSKITSLVNLVDRVYYIVQKFSGNPNCPLDVLASSLKCLVNVTSYEPVQSWLSLQQTGFLPFCVTSLQPSDVKIVMSSVTIDPGQFGNILARERSRGLYCVTLATLDVIEELVPAMSYCEATSGSRINDFIACIIFVCREIFAGYQKWFYNDAKEKQEIGLKCLQIFHAILNLKESSDKVIKTSDATFESSFSYEDKNTSQVSRVSEMVVNAMLWSDIGYSLLKLVAIGVDTIDKVSTTQDSSILLLVDIIKSSLTVLNEVLDSKEKLNHSEEVEISPLEQTLITHVNRKLNNGNSEGVHLVQTVSSYLYIKQDVEIPVLTMKLLRKISFLSPMSLFGSLGSKAKSLRDTFYRKLTSLTEDTKLKVAITDFLTAVVSTQPGLLEVFCSFTGSSSVENKEFASNSCLMPLLANMSNKNPVPVVAASFGFVHALWRNRRDIAMTTVKKTEKFWTKLSQYLMDDLPTDSDEMMICHVQIRSFAFQIIAHELYYVKKNETDSELKKVLEIFESKRRYIYWMKQISSLSRASCTVSDGNEMADTCLNFLKSWRTFLMVLSEVSSVSLTDNDVKTLILVEITRSIETMLEEEVRNYHCKMMMENCSLFLMLLRKWIKAVQSPVVLMRSVAALITVAGNIEETMLARLHIPLCSSISLLLQHVRTERIVEDEMSDNMLSLLPLLCEMIRYRHDLTETKEISRQNKSLSVSFCVLNEIVTYVQQPTQWLQIFTEHALYPNLVQILYVNLKRMENVNVTDALLHFLLTLAKYPESAQVLALNNIIQPLSLGMASILEKLKQLHSTESTEGSQSHDHWHRIWCLGLVIMATLLSKLRYQFLKDSLDFVAVHCTRIIETMNMIGVKQTGSCLYEVECTTMFLIEMSEYSKEWQLSLPGSFQHILSSSTLLLHSCVSLLIRPRLLAYLIEKPSGRDSPERSDKSSVSSRKVSRSLSSTSELLRPYSTPDESIDRQNPEVVETQKLLLRVVCNSLTFLKNFSPNICELLLDEGLDIDEYKPLFTLTFSAPALDNEGSPSFGTLLSCLNVCLGYLQEADPRPLSSPDKSPWKFQALSSILPKSSVSFTMENSVILILSQALLYLKDPRFENANKQLLKRKLASELEPFLRGVMRHFGRRGYTPSPGSTPKSAHTTRGSLSQSRSEHWETGDEKDVKVFKLVKLFLKTFI